MVDGPAVGLVDGDLLLVGVADGQPRHVLLARPLTWRGIESFFYSETWPRLEPGLCPYMYKRSP